MIKIENIEVSGWEAAIRGMRNPMNSWEFIDSHVCQSEDKFEDCYGGAVCHRDEDGISWTQDVFCVGMNDFALMKRLAAGGSVHAKYRRMIIVTMDITAPLYWWKEFDTYKVGTVANSCSTMHKIHDKEFTVDDFSHEHIKNFYGFKENPHGHEVALFENGFRNTIADLNAARKLYLQTGDKQYWWQMIQLLPTSYNQKRTVQISYEVAAALHKDRRHHKLDEWHVICDTLERLPYAEGIIYKIGG